MFGAARF